MEKPRRRAIIQGRMPNPTGSGEVWASPQRDLAFTIPMYLRRAISMTQKKLEGNEIGLAALGEVAKVLGKFVATCVGPESGNDIGEHAAKTGLLNLVTSAGPEYWAVCVAFTQVMLSAYYRGIRDSTHPGEPQAGIEELVEMVEGLTKEIARGHADPEGKPAAGASEPGVQGS